MSRFAVIAAVFLGCAAVGTSGSARAEEASGPQVTGKLAIKPLFEQASKFKLGTAQVKVAGRYSWIDKTGKAIWTEK